MKIIGIDPGASGAIVAILPDHSLEWYQFKDTKSFSTSCPLLKEFIEELHFSDRIYLEHVHSRPGQGAISVFSFGRNLGVIEGMLKQEGLFYTLVSPQRWINDLGLQNVVGKEAFKNADAKKSARKKAYVEHAKKLFPKYKNQITADLADAILIAEYGYRLSLKEEYDV
jgi:hypothetical protein